MDFVFQMKNVFAKKDIEFQIKVISAILCAPTIAIMEFAYHRILACSIIVLQKKDLFVIFVKGNSHDPDILHI
uniref:Uncharacterized protein n=1 Tax=Megaselia scalaris TaxID=36166 RepID=T1GA22_MEGSC